MAVLGRIVHREVRNGEQAAVKHCLHLYVDQALLLHPALLAVRRALAMSTDLLALVLAALVAKLREPAPRETEATEHERDGGPCVHA
ncbi:hypothetical protein [Pengzhenrongella sicca]|uniref:Uncharacterized protein n=1 Tax=Pengzhenrongella sicca TaxID=2819238 RepID=A0A8A4Z9M5_9MICO|nr:hypothetical protein [Pengzhenrongella sicca]QTE28554.1 hypothetical protein J4E96_14435 [Pengzhenrongella sicca]